MTAIPEPSLGQERICIFAIQHNQTVIPRYFGRQVTIVCMVVCACTRGNYRRTNRHMTEDMRCQNDAKSICREVTFWCDF